MEVVDSKKDEIDDLENPFQSVDKTSKFIEKRVSVCKNVQCTIVNIIFISSKIVFVIKI